jgi:hypothetical protein
MIRIRPLPIADLGEAAYAIGPLRDDPGRVFENIR